VWQAYDAPTLHALTGEAYWVEAMPALCSSQSHIRGSGDSGAVLAPSGKERCEPPTPVVMPCVDPAERGARAMEEQCAQIDVPPFAGEQQTGVAHGK
jgi:hypothetical protein